MSVVRSLLCVPYNALVRTQLSRKIGSYNGVAVQYPRFLDFDDYVPDWKDGTVSFVVRAVSPGDDVLEIGTGFGVCTVRVAQEPGQTDQSSPTRRALTGLISLVRQLG